jgi:hypothetical protein
MREFEQSGCLGTLAVAGLEAGRFVEAEDEDEKNCAGCERIGAPD